jgi:hypothetical protein
MVLGMNLHSKGKHSLDCMCYEKPSPIGARSSPTPSLTDISPRRRLSEFVSNFVIISATIFYEFIMFQALLMASEAGTALLTLFLVL